MATKIKRLTEEERKAELKAYAFSEGLKGFFGDNLQSEMISNSTVDIPLETISEAVSVSKTISMLNSIPISNSSNISPETVSETVPILNSIPVSNSELNFPLESISETVPISKTISISNSIPISDSPNMSLETVSETVPILNSIPVPNSASNVPLEAIPETIPVSKTIHIKNKTRSEFDTYYDNYCIKALRALKTQNKSLAALGMLFLVRSLLPSSGGRLKIDRIVSATGMSKSNILAQLEALENVGLMTTITRDISGRLISFPQGTENNTGAELDTHMSSSSFYNKTTSTTIGEMSTEEMDIRNDAHIESNTGNEFDTYTESNTGNKSIDSVFKKRLHNNAISIEFSAQELFFIAKASKVNIDKLTGQCFKYYHDVKGDIGGKYTNGLFLNLLSKAKDNPTAYIIKAIQQGATASLDDETRAEKILKAGEDIFKKIGVDILQKELEVALLLLSSSGKSQEIIQQECKAFIKRMISKA